MFALETVRGNDTLANNEDLALPFATAMHHLIRDRAPPQ